MARASALKEMLKNLGKRIKLEPLAVLKTNPDGAGIVQAIGPLKVLAGNCGLIFSIITSRALTFSFE